MMRRQQYISSQGIAIRIYQPVFLIGLDIARQQDPVMSCYL